MEERSLLKVVEDLKAKGFYPVQWIKSDQGYRADEPGKFQIPAHSETKHVCSKHGNAVKVIRETVPSRNRGVKILEVHPCFLCKEA